MDPDFAAGTGAVPDGHDDSKLRLSRGLTAPAWVALSNV
jgi:hypothetical protein